MAQVLPGHARPAPDPLPDPFRLAAERYLVDLGLRRARLAVEGDTARIEADPRDLWRIVGRRDEVLLRLVPLGVGRVTLDLGTPAADLPRARLRRP